MPLLKFLFLSQSLLRFSQFYDNFLDRDFTYSPSCFGDSLRYEIDSLGFLHYKTDTLNGESMLFTESIVSQNSMWQFKTHYNFSPSTSILCKSIFYV